MKEVFIKHNPYRLTTDFTVDGKPLASSSKIGEIFAYENHLQDWIDDLPELLVEEYNDSDYKIKFYGTEYDFEDVKEAFLNAEKSLEIKVEFESIAAKGTKDKEILVDELFKKIQEGPFDELKTEDIISSFEKAKKDDFEVCVVATMSAGKSTLINSLLGTKLMPSKSEACTAIITEIKDTDSENWSAEVFNKDNEVIDSYDDITYDKMVELNSNKDVSKIKIKGNIPFVTSEETSLVLIDTPGPNNSRDAEHRIRQKEFLNKNSKALVLYIMESTFGSDDDNALLKTISESMEVKGKQSKDRFIFVVNKIDLRGRDDGKTELFLDKVEEYLNSHNIYKPNIFLTSSLQALNICLKKQGSGLDEYDIYEVNGYINKSNNNPETHAEQFASLPTGRKNELIQRAAEAKRENLPDEEAFIHTGIPSVESAISQYVEKYAKNAKLKNIVDTFSHNLEELNTEAEIKKEILEKKENRKEINALLNKVSDELENINNVNDLAKKIEEKSREIEKTIIDEIDRYRLSINQKITQSFKTLRETKKLTKSNIDEFNNLGNDIQTDLISFAESTINDGIVQTSNELMNEYKEKLSKISKEINSSNMSTINIDLGKFVSSKTLKITDSDIKKYTKTETVTHSVHRRLSLDPRSWFKSWGGYFDTIETHTVNKTDYVKLYNNWFAKVQKNVFDFCNILKEEIKHYILQTKIKLKEHFEETDKLLNEKIDNLKTLTAENQETEIELKLLESNYKWLIEVKEQLDAILDI